MKTSISNAQKQAIMIHVRRLKLDKDELVYGASGGRTTSLRELTSDEARQLLSNLFETDPAQPMRKKIFSMAHEMRWVQSNNPGKVDSNRLDQVLIKFGYLHKPLMQYKYEELPRLVTQVENMLASYLNKK